MSSAYGVASAGSTRYGDPQRSHWLRAPQSRTARITASGSRSSTASSTHVGPVGCRLPCSQFSRVFELTPIIAANSRCVSPVRSRISTKRCDHSTTAVLASLRRRATENDFVTVATTPRQRSPAHRPSLPPTPPRTASENPALQASSTRWNPSCIAPARHGFQTCCTHRTARTSPSDAPLVPCSARTPAPRPCTRDWSKRESSRSVSESAHSFLSYRRPYSV
jgi:hypothetical protein